MGDRYQAAFILPNGFTLGGTTTWSLELGTQLQAKGERVVLINHCQDFAEAVTASSVNLDITACVHPLHPNNWFLRKSDVETYVAHYQTMLPAVFIPNYSYGAYAACAMLSLNHPDEMRVIGVAHTDMEDYYHWLVEFESIIHLFIAVSREIGDRLKVLLPHRASDIMVKPHAFISIDDQPRMYSSPDAPLRLLYGGRLTERQKRISDLVGLAALLNRQQTDFLLDIYGAGRDQGYLRSLITKLPEAAAQRITCHGQVDFDEMGSCYRKADLSILVSEYEGTSISMLESMAHGCVPLVTRVSGTAEIIDNGVNGYCFEVGEISAMSQTITNLGKSRQELSRLGANARQTVGEMSGTSDYVSWFRDCLEQTWQNKPRSWQKKRLPAFYLPLRSFLKESGYTLASKTGLHWLYALKQPARRLLGSRYV